MVTLRRQDGKIIIKDGKVGTEQECCCNKCSGPCVNDTDCADGCFCCDGQCEESGCCCVDLAGGPGLYSFYNGFRITKKLCEYCGFDSEDAGFRIYGTWIPGCFVESPAGEVSESCTTHDWRPFTPPAPGCDTPCGN